MTTTTTRRRRKRRIVAIFLLILLIDGEVKDEGNITTTREWMATMDEDGKDRRDGSMLVHLKRWHAVVGVSTVQS